MGSRTALDARLKVGIRTDADAAARAAPRRWQSAVPVSRDPARPRRPRVKIVEVSPRDGLQNEKTLLSADIKASLTSRLAQNGLTHIEAGSFVSPRLKQMANTAELLQRAELNEGNLNTGVVNTGGHANKSYSDLSVLVPNLRGWQDFTRTLPSMTRRPSEVAVFVAATESFSRANLNMSIAQSLDAAAEVAEHARAAGFRVRGYVSCVAGCPYEGSVEPRQVAIVAEQLQAMGCYEVSLGDTVGTGSPTSLEAVLDAVTARLPVESVAAHCHDTYGLAITNVLHLVRLGVRTVDSSVAGLGGCPYAPGASGNVATEDVVYALEREGYDTGLVGSQGQGSQLLPKGAPAAVTVAASSGSASAHPPPELADLLRSLVPLAETGEWISNQLGRPTSSKVGRAVLATSTRER